MPEKSSTPPQKPSLTSPYPIAGRPWQRRFPTPRIQDYIVSVREDTRVAEFVMPKKGDVFKGVDQQKRLSKSYTFATAVPVEQLPGFVDLYYIAPFCAQEDYNFTVEYPYADRDYPRFTRTYIVPRTDDVATAEPQADTYDPKFGRPFQLTDHKIERFTDDPVLDAQFVKVLRIFERLPSPVITSFESNQFQQVVTVKTQEVVTSAPPAQSALTEGMKQERTGTAKAKNTLGSVSIVFPATSLTAEIPSMTRELWLGGFIENTKQQFLAGQAQQPVLNSAGEYMATEKQTTLYKKEVTTKTLPTPQSRQHSELTEEFGGGTLEETIQIAGPLDPQLLVEEGYLITESRVRIIPDVIQIKIQKQLPFGSWPVLHGLHMEVDGIYYGIKIPFTKQFIPDGQTPAATPSHGSVEIQAHDKWRSIQIISQVDLSSLPAPATITNFAFVHLDLPPLLLGVFANFDKSAVAAWSVSPDATTATAKATVTVHGEVGHVMLDGFRGPVVASLYRQFFTHAPTAADLAALGLAPSVIQPAIAVATIRSLTNSLAESKDISGLITSEITVSGHRFGRLGLPPALTGYLIANPINPYTGPNPFQVTSDNNAAGQTGNGNDLVILQGPGAAYSKVAVTIPMSKVTGPRILKEGMLSPGDVLVTEVRCDDWKFGIWVLEAITVTVPNNAYVLPAPHTFGPT